VSVYGETRLIDWARVARRIVIWTALTAAAVMAVGMALSYVGLRGAYTGAGFAFRAAAVAPLCVDLLTLVAYVGLLVLAGKAYPTALVAFGIGFSAFAQGFHGTHGSDGGRITNWLVVGLLWASPIVFAGLAGHLTWLIVKRAAPADFILSLRGDEQVSPPRALRAPPLERDEPDVPDWVNGELESAFADYDTRELVRSMNGHNPPEMRLPDRMPDRPQVRATVAARPAVGAPSQKKGPCSARCTHHVNETVSKSTRYRCQAGLDGKPNGCPDCAKTRSTS
jgi:hypothetical protein